MKVYLYSILFLALTALSANAQDGFDPTPPGEPNALYRITVGISHSAAGTVSGGGSFAEGTRITIRRNDTGFNSSATVYYKFKCWMLNGEEYTQAGTSSSFTYTVDKKNAAFQAVYEVLNPDEVSSRLYLVSEPKDACTFNVSNGVRYLEGNSVYLYYNTTSSTFKFQGWYNGDELVTKSNYFYYTIGEDDATLTARFTYEPTIPGEPSGNQENVDCEDEEKTANDFRATHITILSKTIDDVAVSDIASIETALNAYAELSDAAKGLLESEKSHLDSLKARAEELKAAEEADAAATAEAETFKTDNAEILDLTTSTVQSSDLDAINAALEAYNQLSDAAKEKVATEKSLLDALKARAEEKPLSTVDMTAKAGNTILIPVSLSNTVGVYGLQCDIYLSSDKMSITKDSRGRYVFTPNADRVDGQTASSKLQSDGAVRYMIADYTAENPFAGNDGELFYISVDIPEGVEGEYSVNIRNIILATDERKILCPDIVSKITVLSYTLGDVDYDGSIDVQDVLRTAQLVLNSSYNIAADMDEDKLIDVQDVIMVAKAVLEQDVVSSASKSAAKAIYKNSFADNISLCSPADGTIDVTLNNKEEYHGFQMDVELPVGYSFSQDANGDAEISINDRKLSDFSVMQKMFSDSKMRILVFNDSQNAIPQNVGELFRFKIKKDNTTISDVCDVRISNVIFSHDTGKVVLSGQVKSFEISDVTGINSVNEKMPEQDVYTVNGKRVKTPIKNSIYIVNGKKRICK